MKTLIVTAGIAVFVAGTANAQVIGLVDFDGTETGLIGYSNSVVTYTGAGFGTDANLLDANLGFASTTWGSGDAFYPVTRAALGPVPGVGMPFGLSDDSVEAATGNTVFPTDTAGFAGIAFNNNGFFGMTDTVNSANPGDSATASFVFDIFGATNIMVSMDWVAQGDFEATDALVVEYDIDGGGFFPLFTATVNEDIDQTYTMDNPDNNPVILADPMLINGVLLDDNYQTLSASVAGTGSTLTIRVTGTLDGGSEGIGFDNLKVSVPTPGALALFGLAGVITRRRRRR
jgi:MYXO-CTERM domain-containing protein